MKSDETDLVSAPITGEPDGERGVGITAGWGWAGRFRSGEARWQNSPPGITQGGSVRASTLPKTVVAVEELHDARCGLISVMAHPTTGGLLASFASLGDVLLAEPGALMSFAGPRVVAQTTREKLPDDFGLAESNLRHGHIDLVVPRPELRDTVARVVALLSGGQPYRRTPLLPDLGAQRAVGRVISGARKAILGRRNEHVDD